MEFGSKSVGGYIKQGLAAEVRIHPGLLKKEKDWYTNGVWMKKCGWIHQTGFGSRSEDTSRIIERRKGLVYQWSLDEKVWVDTSNRVWM